MSAGRVVWGLVLVGLGVLFLITNLGWVEWGFALSLLQLWPLALVLIGIDLLLGDRSRALAVVLMVAVLAVGVGVAALTWQDGGWRGWGSTTTATIEGPAVTGISEAKAVIKVGGAQVGIKGEQTGLVVKGTFDSATDPTVDQTTDATTGAYTLNVSQGEGQWVIIPFVTTHEDLDLRLAPDVPWDLTVETGATDATLDLSDVTLSRLSLKSGASTTDLTIGPRVTSGRAEVAIEGGVGTYHIRLPRSLDIVLQTDTGVSTLDVDQDGFSETEDDTYIHTGGGDDLLVRVKTGVSTVKVELY